LSNPVSLWQDTLALPLPLRMAAKDKAREKDLESRAMIIDSLLLLASTANSRKLMREKNIVCIFPFLFHCLLFLACC
jgi:hypothetical protein